jgi:hypothetical protein
VAAASYAGCDGGGVVSLGRHSRNPEVRCDRRTPHPGHTYVANPRSGVDLTCPGLTANRSVAQLLAEQPALADLPLVGVLRHTLEVAAA